MLNISFEKEKTPTAIKNKVRDEVFKKITSMFEAEFGADNVSIVGNTEASVAVTTVTLKDGTIGEICVNIKPVVKDFDDRTTTSGKKVAAYERIKEAEVYEIEKAAKQKPKNKQA